MAGIITTAFGDNTFFIAGQRKSDMLRTASQGILRRSIQEFAMRWMPALLVVGAFASFVQADPLAVVPDKSEIVVKIEKPRQIADSVYNLDFFKELQKLPAFREAYDTTNARRFFQLVAYFEKELGHPYLDLIDRLAGGGVVLGARFSDNPSVVVAIQAKDKDLLHKFAKLSMDILTEELARQDVKEKPKTTTYKDIDVMRLAKEVHLALAGDTLIFASNGKAMQSAIDTLKDGKSSMAANAEVARARKQLPAGPLAWGWVNLAAVRSIPAVKAGFDTLSLDPQVIFILGGFVDVGLRSPHLVGGIYQKQNEFTLAVRAASGRHGMRGAELLSPTKGPGSLPLLEPANVLASSSWHLDLAKLWEQRAKIFNEKQLETLEKFEKESGKFLGGIKLGQLLPQAGPHQRLVVTQQTKIGYKTQPKTKYPAFALVQSMREPEFGKNMETLLRGAAFLASLQANLKMNEEKHGKYSLVGYRFPEDKDVFVGADYATTQFNFSPCFASVKNQFIMSSTIELCRELIDLIDKEDPQKNTSTSTTRQRFYSSGGADILRGNQELLLTQLILSQALAPKAAKEQLRQLIDIVDRAGVLNMEIQYGANDARMNLRVTLGSKK
jgi:hypothetical protein